jgi:sirohydrochlorin cobaltochelatase
MKTMIVLAMHGVPANDFPRDELREFFELHSRLEMSPGPRDPALEIRHKDLEDRVMRWPRTPRNDPYHAASYELARALRAACGLEVIVGFNEFCSPGVEEALARAVAEGAGAIILVTSMLTRGGEHAERDIAQALERARKTFPDVRMIYAWPFETEAIARFLAEHIAKFRSDPG